MRAVEGNLGHSPPNPMERKRKRAAWRFPVLAQRAASEGPRWTRARREYRQVNLHERQETLGIGVQSSRP
jgi:hypothetical protein